MAATPKVLIGICAYNEENNIGRLLQNLIDRQNLPATCRIMVISSGCTDRTPDIVKKYQAKDSRVELFVEEHRTGKASALNRIFEAARESADVLVLVNADALPAGGSIAALVNDLSSCDAGAVFARPVPFEGLHGTCYGIVRVIWLLHHGISLLQKPKLSGELCAIRVSCIRDIPGNVATDEPYIELAIHKQGHGISYVPNALVSIRCPTNVVDLMKQRKRIWIGHMQLQKETGFKVPTTNVGNIMHAISALRPTELAYFILGGALEAVAYIQARVITYKGHIPYAWEPIRSTKT